MKGSNTMLGFFIKENEEEIERNMMKSRTHKIEMTSFAVKLQPHCCHFMAVSFHHFCKFECHNSNQNSNSNKSQVFSVFEKFKALVEKQSACQLKTLRSDNDKEYTSSEFDKFYEDASIVHQLIVPYTPQQNGVAERKNKTIMVMARCILYEKKLPMNFWVEAVNTAVYLLNGLPTKAIKGMTPIEVGTKLDVKAKPGIFVRYATESKCYRIYNMATKKVIVHRDADQNLIDDLEVAGIDAYQDTPVLKSRKLLSIYEKCNMAMLEPGVDYGNTFAPVARHDTINLLLALSTCMGWKLYHMDVKIDSFLVQQGFVRSENEPTLYVKVSKGEFSTQMTANHDAKLLISLYVDDLLITGSNLQSLQYFKFEMMKEFEMSDLGQMSYFLGMEITQMDGGIFVSYQKYALNVLKKFNMGTCKFVYTPLVQNEKMMNDDGSNKVDASIFRSLVGSLLFLTTTKPDLMFSASLLSRFMHSPSQVHYNAAKRVLRYLKEIADYGLMLKKSNVCVLKGYADSDWDVVAQSTAEIEYIAAAEATNHSTWICKMLTNMGYKQIQPCVLCCDNNSAIAIAHNPMQHGRTKHMNVNYHVLRNTMQNNELKIVYYSMKEQVADILTKAQPRAKFEMFKEMLGMSKKNCEEE
ncbi:hypothetical protein SLEP1_g15904 [Rubroshorea leprosula]|uniref:Integrase catalytic domain-containing protein n=1 Tax=Rubroshorea leprosula TaxID=152421 RepID=A0AAV5IXW0_9ROSI|nr:hypothetical protein SLEP1_g15904 [Rubroshorea leprosula]